MIKSMFLFLTILWMSLPCSQAMDKEVFEVTNEISTIKPEGICVFCSADDKILPIFKEYAHTLGKKLALANETLITGGSNTGLMKEVVDGFTTINKKDVYGVLPGIFKDHQIEHPAIPKDRLIWTKDMADRFKNYHALSKACIVLPGGWGTLHELMDYLVSDQFGIHKTTIILANFEGFWNPLLLQFRTMMDTKALYFKHFDRLKIANDINEILFHLEDETDTTTHGGLAERFWEDSPSLPKETDESPSSSQEEDEQLIFPFSYDKDK